MRLNQPSFAAGEISPELYGRVDQELYYIGLRKCKNFLIRQYGGASNRPGTKFICEARYPDKKARLIPFQFNEEQTYILELGDEYMRIIADGAQVVEAPKTITAATKADPCVITSVAHGYTNGQDVYVSGVVGMTELNGRFFRVANKTNDTFELNDFQGNNIDSTGYTIYASGGTAERVYTVATPWGEADLFDLNFAQSNDVLTVVHPSYYPRDITRSSNAAWTVTEFGNSLGPFKALNSGATTVYSDAATGSVTLTASASLFDSGMVGELFYIAQEPDKSTETWEPAKAVTANDIRKAGAHFYEAQNSATTGTVRPDFTEGKGYDGDGAVEWEYLHSGFGIVSITGYTSATVVTGTVVSTLPTNVVGSGNASTIWAKAAWSASEGYPSAVAYHKQRLCFGGTANQPNGVWFSQTALRSVFGVSNPILDDDSITLQLDTTQLNAIRHFLPLTELIVLTSASEIAVNGIDNVISAVDLPVARVQGYTGASKVIPLIIGNNALFVQDMGSVVRSLQYNQNTNTFAGLDLSARSPHLLRGKTVVDWSFQKHPLSVIWVTMSDGSLNGFTFMDEQQVYAWSRHQTDGLFESNSTIREDEESATYVVVKRTVNGLTSRYIERFSTRYFPVVRDSFFVDSGLTYDGRNFTERLVETTLSTGEVINIVEKTATTATTITISGGTTWDSPEVITLTASASIFKSTDVGDQIVFRYYDSDYNEIALRLTIDGYTSGTVVTAIPTKLVPVALRSTASLYWEFARDTFLPLDHLEGEDVSILADGNVVEGKTVSGGRVTLDSPAAVVHIGLPYICDLETLDLSNSIGNQGSLKTKSLNVPRVFLTVQETRGIFVGINGFENVKEVKQRAPEMGYDPAIPAETDVFEVLTNSQWSSKGRICIRQSKPLPVSILCITPEVVLGQN